MALDATSDTQVQLQQGGKVLAIGPTGTLSVDSAATVTGLAKTGAAVTDLTDGTGGTPSATLAAITAGASYAQADLVAIKNAISSLAATLNTLQDTLRAAGAVQ